VNEEVQVMLRQIIHRPGLRRGGCHICGLQFSEEFVRRVNACLIMCFCYMIIVEASDYYRYQQEGKCNKPFGLFWIGHFTSIVLFLVFVHVEKYFIYQLRGLIVVLDNSSLRRARFWACTMKGCKLLAYIGFLVFTIIGCVWLVEDGRCLNTIDKTSNNQEIKMAFWLLASFSVCVIYAIRAFTGQVLEDAVEPADNNSQFNLISWANQVERRGGRNLTQREINTITKMKLCSYDQLSRFSKKSQRFSREMPTKVDTMATNQPIAMNENSAVAHDESELKQHGNESSQGACAICLEGIVLGNWFKKLPQCEHCFHASCIDEWLSKRATCPVCRQEIFLDENLLDRPVDDGDNPPIESGHRSDREPPIVLRFTRVVS